MEKIDLQYLVAPFIETALADAYKRGAADWDQSSGYFPDWSAVQANYVKGAVASYAEPMATALTVAGHAAAYDVLFERMRQREQEKFDNAHDDEALDGSLARAAACYAIYESPGASSMRDTIRLAVGWLWPWAAEWFKPKDHRRNMVKAAALAIAEIERIDREAAKVRG